MVIVSGQVINQLTGFFIGNVTIMVYLIQLNENLRREVGLWIQKFSENFKLKNVLKKSLFLPFLSLVHALPELCASIHRKKKAPEKQTGEDF